MVHTIPYCPTSGFPLNHLSLNFGSQGILLIIAIMQQKQQNHLFEIEWTYLFSAKDIKYLENHIKVKHVLGMATIKNPSRFYY